VKLLKEYSSKKNYSLVVWRSSSEQPIVAVEKVYTLQDARSSLLCHQRFNSLL